jgi:hypothetical protein
MPESAFYSLLRWRPDPARDEAKNVAVVIVGEGDVGGIRSAPISTISPKLHDQGILDSALRNFERQFTEGHCLTLGQLEEMSTGMVHSLTFTPPLPTLVEDVDVTLTALYRALVGGPSGGSRILTKGKVLDNVVRKLRRDGYEVGRGQYLDDFIFDAVLEEPNAPLLGVLSFATSARNFVGTEQSAGHFLYGLENVGRSGLAIIAPPTASSHENANLSFHRVSRWLQRADCAVASPEEVSDRVGELLSD